jgi:hypothetical protein
MTTQRKERYCGLHEIARLGSITTANGQRFLQLVQISIHFKKLSLYIPDTVHAKFDDRDTPSTGYQVPTEQLSWLKRLLMTARDGVDQKVRWKTDDY